MAGRSPLQRIGDQFGAPSGRGARMVAGVLNLVNRGVNADAVVALAPRPGERVADLGFGGGVSLRALLEAVGSDGTVVAIERSPELVARARRKLTDLRLTVVEGEASATGLEDGELDGLLSVNTVYFWPDLGAGTAEFRRVLREDGRAVVLVEAKILAEHTRAGRSTLGSIDEVESALLEAGFGTVTRRAARRGAVLLIAR